MQELALPEERVPIGRVARGTAVLRREAPPRTQTPTCVVCGLTASVRCAELPAEQEGNDRSQGSAERQQE